MKGKNRQINEWMRAWDSESICRWMDSRKGHRKARWLKMLNRTLDYWREKIFGYDPDAFD